MQKRSHAILSFSKYVDAGARCKSHSEGDSIRISTSVHSNWASFVSRQLTSSSAEWMLISSTGKRLSRLAMSFFGTLQGNFYSLQTYCTLSWELRRRISFWIDQNRLGSLYYGGSLLEAKLFEPWHGVVWLSHWEIVPSLNHWYQNYQRLAVAD